MTKTSSVVRTFQWVPTLSVGYPTRNTKATKRQLQRGKMEGCDWLSLREEEADVEVVEW